MPGSKKRIPQTVVSIGLKTGSKELVPELFIEQVVQDHPVFIRRTGTVQTHLKVLVIDLDLMEREFKIGKQSEIPAPVGRVFDRHVPEQYIIPHRN